MATADQILSVRIELADTDISFPMLADSEYSYFIDKNAGSISRSAMDAAKTILLKLSMRGDESVDLFSIKGSSAARAYAQALQMYIKNPDLNSLYNTVQGYASGISKSDMQANYQNTDNNYSIPPQDDRLFGQSSLLHLEPDTRF